MRIRIPDKWRVRADGTLRLPGSKYKVYEGEAVAHGIERIPFLKTFIWKYDEFSILHGLYFEAHAINYYFKEMKLQTGDRITIEIINELLALARQRGDI